LKYFDTVTDLKESDITKQITKYEGGYPTDAETRFPDAALKAAES